MTEIKNLTPAQLSLLVDSSARNRKRNERRKEKTQQVKVPEAQNTSYTNRFQPVSVYGDFLVDVFARTDLIKDTFAKILTLEEVENIFWLSKPIYNVVEGSSGKICTDIKGYTLSLPESHYQLLKDAKLNVKKTFLKNFFSYKPTKETLFSITFDETLDQEVVSEMIRKLFELGFLENMPTVEGNRIRFSPGSSINSVQVLNHFTRGQHGPNWISTRINLFNPKSNHKKAPVVFRR